MADTQTCPLKNGKDSVRTGASPAPLTGSHQRFSKVLHQIQITHTDRSRYKPSTRFPVVTNKLKVQTILHQTTKSSLHPIKVKEPGLFPEERGHGGLL